MHRVRAYTFDFFSLICTVLLQTVAKKLAETVYGTKNRPPSKIG